jgi:2-dehydro-3-deoxyphosphooctonate aldolase (KDO 8-P synthase)
MPSHPIKAGKGHPLLLIAGPDVVEGEDHLLKMAESLQEIAASRPVSFVFKASFDKANRTSVSSFRGPGMEAGLELLAKVKARTGVAITTDFHTPDQAEPVAGVADILQVPAFLCRQTDMLIAAGNTGKLINVKKGQFLAPWDARHIVEKVRSTGNQNIMLTERGSTVGYNNLSVDFRSLARMRSFGVPVCFDATHAVQLPGGQGGSSGGEREFVEQLARAAVAIGVDALFFEVHDDPDNAPCDGPNMLELHRFPEILDRILEIDALTRSHFGS